MCIRDRVSTQSTGGCGTSGMAGIFHISRGGTRGKGDFSWDSVKNDEERENYLGHSLNAPVGRWQRGKDLQWWTKNKDGGDKDAIKAQRAAEMKRIQMEEQVMMEEAMGMRPRRERHQIEMEAHELREVLKRGQVAEEQREFYNNADRVEGLGFAPTVKVADTAGIDVDENEPSKAVLQRALGEEMVQIAGEKGIDGISGDELPDQDKYFEREKPHPPAAPPTKEERKVAKKAAKKEKKQAKKAAKKEKKAAKKEARAKEPPSRPARAPRRSWSRSPSPRGRGRDRSPSPRGRGRDRSPSPAKRRRRSWSRD
eukprot:TRINITY_DN12190_c0_g2_i2.p1 TRINITY_DN12190_c0_g2~~TRINITY_DN12190_c0_g2_i2.p1  ORF type:complete len:312 (+),score=87.98 TRINITY_DN12190_c0_g2_i2:179-1114(+)